MKLLDSTCLLRCAAGIFLAGFGLAGCSGPADGQVFTLTAPDEMTFPPVSKALEIRCGTLDCHGSISRNLRMYGIDGIRADKADITGMNATTTQELHYNYEALVSIQPEVLSFIVSHAGQNFDKWIVVTKGTNAEHHKGGQRFTKGDDTYNCLKSWVTGAVNDAACQAAGSLMAPGGDQF